ncbi:MAG: RNA-directed DNA polymerase [Anaerolineae bacterium]|nr:RNA-directed DNA polymerase [Anaerolineae bacterium]
MLNDLPNTLRRLVGLPPAYRYTSPARNEGEWSMVTLCYRLGLKVEDAHQIMDSAAFPSGFRYREFTIPKRDGSPRQLLEPGPKLKQVQRRILTMLLRKAQPHHAAYGFRRKKSIADHAWAHANSRIIITADIQDFFPNTTRQHVKQWWHEQGFSTPEVRLLTALTTLHGSLPQGAPTSPPLSNLVNAQMDTALERHIQASGGIYTRYADDLCFSWPEGYAPPADFEFAVRSVLHEYGYALHPDKGWQVWDRDEEPTITGVVITKHGSVDIPDSMKRIMRTLQQHGTAADDTRLQGYQGYQRMITREPRPEKASAGLGKAPIKSPRLR